MTQNEVTYHAYCLASAFLTIALRDGDVENACEGAGHSQEDTQRIEKAIEQIIAQMTNQSNHSLKRGARS